MALNDSIDFHHVSLLPNHYPNHYPNHHPNHYP